MRQRDVAILLLGAAGALLLTHLIRPESPSAFDMPATPLPIAISASGDSAWAMVGDRVYFVTLRSPSDLPRRIITQVDAQTLRQEGSR